MKIPQNRSWHRFRRVYSVGEKPFNKGSDILRERERTWHTLIHKLSSNSKTPSFDDEQRDFHHSTALLCNTCKTDRFQVIKIILLIPPNKLIILNILLKIDAPLASTCQKSRPSLFKAYSSPQPRSSLHLGALMDSSSGFNFFTLRSSTSDGPRFHGCTQTAGDASERRSKAKRWHN